ncbi:MAG: GGDEF domain-containing protein [Lachnospiraceae bacterium]|nr:GGDEF domain-containing protein [Lachnospiraceae bacterium]
MKKRLNIALCIAMLDAELSVAICEGALRGAKKTDVNLFIIPGGIMNEKFRPNDEEWLRYNYQYNALYSCLKPQSLDAVIIEYGVITSLLDEKEKKEFLKGFGKIPILLLAGSQEGYHSITIDNKAGIRQAVQHLVEMHECKKVGFVSGPVTNQDANERLAAYREAVKQYGLEDSEELIAYGDFTEFYPDITKDLIRANPGIEAIVYANDQMAASGYTALRQMDLEPGRDILITGFDDSRFCLMMEPHLTSVKADAGEIGYRAVLACKDLIAGTYRDEQIESRLVVRESCGCNPDNIAKRIIDRIEELSGEELVDYLAKELIKEYFSFFYDPSKKEAVSEILKEYFTFYFKMAQPNGSLQFAEDALKEAYGRFIRLNEKGYMSLETLFLIDQILYHYISARVRDVDQCLRLTEIITILREKNTSNIRSKKLLVNEQNRTYETILSNITRDMLLRQFRDEAKRYETVSSKLQVMGYTSSYIYTYENGIINDGKTKWHMPEKLYLKGGHDRDTVKLYAGAGSEVDCAEIFSDRFMPTDRRFDMLVLPLFTGEMQYGMLLLETETGSFRYAQQVAFQISVSMEAINIIKEQKEIKKQLEENLARSVAANKMLDEMSRLDPMTGVTNRRGFFDTIHRILKDPQNFGRKAVAVYADMDNLKIVNDEFGHDEGDYAIKTIARVLSESFRSSDVVGRMGGDEFAAFAIVNQNHLMREIRNRIQTSMKEFNDASDKPYYVNISLGIYEFVINPDTDFEQILKEADAKLYMEKKEKKKQLCIYKNITP